MADYQISTTLKADVDKFKRAFKRAIGDTEQFKAVAKSIKDVKLKADASGVTKGVESAKKALDGFDSLDADAKLDVDATHLKTHIAIAKDLVSSFDDIDADAELSADISEAIKNINALESYIERIDNNNADVEITADVTKANARIRELQTNLRAINGRHYSANLDADATKARKSILMAKRALNDFSRQRAKAKLEVENKAAVSNIVMFKAMLRSIPNIVRTRLVVDNKKAVGGLKALHQGLENANNVLDTVANDIRTFGTVFSNMIRGVMLSNISLLVPAIASIVPALFAVLNAAGVVAGGAIGMAGAFGVATAGAFAFGAMAVSALKMVQDGTLEATREVQNYQKSLSGLKSTWEGIIKQNQAQIFNTLANGINTAKVALQGLTPFINGVSKGMEQASAKMLDWAKNSQVAQKFFQMMGTTGVRIFNNMLNAAGQFGSGIISILTQLAPLAEWVSKGFEKMGASFNKWAQSTAGQNAIKSFIEYTKQNLPLIGQIFGNTFKGIFNLMKAFAPNTHLILQSLAQMSAKFAEWSATIAESDGFKKFIQYVQENGPKLITLMGNIIRILIAVGTAMAPLASAVLNVAVAITGFIARLTEAHPAIGAILGVLATLAGIFMTIGPPILSAIGFISKFAMALTGAESAIAAFSAIGGALMTALEGLAAAFSLLLSPIGLIVAAVAAVIAIFVALWNSSEVLRDTVTGAWNAIKNAVGAAVKAVIAFFKDLMGQFGYVKGGVDSLAQVWAGFVKTVEFYIKLLTPIFSSTFKGIVVIVKVVWEVIKAVITVAMHVIVGTITALLQLLTGDWEGAWKTLSQAGEAIWNAIVEMAKNIFNILKDTLVQIWQRIVSFFSEVFGPLTAIASQIWQGIVNVIVTVVQALGTFLSAIWQGIVTVATTIWTTLVTIATTLWNLLVTTITTIVTTLGTILSTIWTTIVTVATTIWTTLVTIASTIW
ncbi:phage tail protein, partial [Rhodococcus fascians]|nr:phage tail protein [Rhodococcus fascians]